MNLKVTVAQNSGFCFGVTRAVDIINDLIRQGKSPIFTLGELIHNDEFLKRLEENGVRALKEDELFSTAEKYPDMYLVIRAHGIRKELCEKLENKGINYIDATCPFVKKIHKIVDENSNENTDVIIGGDKNHPEVEGICSYAKGDVYVFSNEEEIDSEFSKNSKFGKNPAILVSQTTNSVNNYKKCQKKIKKLYTNLIIFDTICNVTEKRQKEAKLIASNSDIMFVLGGTHSSNAKKLYEICANECENTYFAQTADDIPFDEIRKVIQGNKSLQNKNIINAGITAGASTPDDIIEEVKNKMTKELENVLAESEEMDFAKMLEQSMKSISIGETVEGIITSISSAEIHVDLGIKQTGIIPYSEFSDDSSADPVKLCNVGDTIAARVIKFNDAEGVVTLSKKRLEGEKIWTDLAAAVENGVVLEGKVVEAVKSGVMFKSGSYKLFVPASLTGLSRSKENPVTDDELKALVGKETKCKIVEVDARKKRAIGSIKGALYEERQAIAEKFWASVEVGQKFTGTIKSLTNYGAFVDLGGVDGMVHISELSWKRLRHPSEVVKVGDSVDVFIKEIDAEKKRISLGMKTEETNPWNIFCAKYAEGDTAEVKIVSTVPFGAFAEIVPGVDGLIHISQISNKKVTKPEDELKVGETVSAKIIAVDNENAKVSLSIRALLAPEEEAVEAVEEETEETTAE